MGPSLRLTTKLSVHAELLTGLTIAHGGTLHRGLAPAVSADSVKRHARPACSCDRRAATRSTRPGDLDSSRTNQQASGDGGGAIVAGSQCSSALPSTKRQVSNHVVE